MKEEILKTIGLEEKEKMKSSGRPVKVKFIEAIKRILGPEFWVWNDRRYLNSFREEGWLLKVWGLKKGK